MIQPCLSLVISWLKHFQIEVKHSLVIQFCVEIYDRKNVLGRSQRPRGLRRGSVAAGLLESPVRTPPDAWMSVPRESFVLSGS